MNMKKYITILVLLCCCFVTYSCSDSDDNKGDANLSALYSKIDKTISDYRQYRVISTKNELIGNGNYEVQTISALSLIGITITSKNKDMTNSVLLSKLKEKYGNKTIVNRIYLNKGGGISIQLD